MEIKEIRVKMFPPGKKILHQGETYTVDHVRIKKGTLFVKFVELSTEVDSRNIPCESTTFVLKYIIKKGGRYACCLVN